MNGPLVRAVRPYGKPDFIVRRGYQGRKFSNMNARAKYLDVPGLHKRKACSQERQLGFDEVVYIQVLNLCVEFF